MNGQNTVATLAKSSPRHICSQLRRICLAPGVIVAGLSDAMARMMRRFSAITRLSLSAVCEESAELGLDDYHTFVDDEGGAVWSTQGGAFCKRCGKKYRL